MFPVVHLQRQAACDPPSEKEQTKENLDIEEDEKYPEGLILGRCKLVAIAEVDPHQTNQRDDGKYDDDPSKK